MHKALRNSRYRFFLKQRSSAVFHGRNYVIPEDVKVFAVPALAHRLILKSSEWLGGNVVEEIIEEILSKTVAPRKDIQYES